MDNSLRKRVLIINFNGGSPFHGPNLRTYYVAKCLLDRGHEVTCVSNSYSHKYTKLPKVEENYTIENISGVEYIWIKGQKYNSIFKRLLCHWTFVVNFIRLEEIRKRSFDIILSSSPPPEVFICGMWKAYIDKAIFIIDIRDIWPLAIIETNWLHKLNPYIWFQFLIFIFAARVADFITSPLQKLDNYFVNAQIKKKIKVFLNGAPDLLSKKKRGVSLFQVGGGYQMPDGYVPVDRIREENKFVVGYSGSFDRDNDVGSLLAAAEMSVTNEDVLFLLIGSGVLQSSLITRASNLPNVVICERVDAADVGEVIGCFNVCYCGLKDKNINLYGVGLAKVSEYLSIGKPLLWMIRGGVDPISDGAGGIKISPGDIHGLVDAIKYLSTNPSVVCKMGVLSREYFEKNYDYKVISDKWAKFIERISIND